MEIDNRDALKRMRACLGVIIVKAFLMLLSVAILLEHFYE